MSSPVKLAGAGSHSTRPRSSTSPLRGSLSLRSAARRGSGSVPPSLPSTADDRGPESRITATPARPVPLDSAQMVPRPSLMRSSLHGSAFSLPSWVIVDGMGGQMTDAPAGEHAEAGNRLGEETSPYLLQHRDNPVHWWAWGPEALAEAKLTGKPVLLSIGYAACHWCHVMAHESFENSETAALMNELFVNIKVDREERPDVDTLYMTALHELGEQGGWPLTMFLTPDGMPFFGGTYFPDLPRYGRPSFRQVLENVARVYAQEKETIEQNTAYLKTRLTPRLNYGPAPHFSEEQLAAVASKFIGAIDPANGG